jgi:DUF1680 family protein
VTADISSLTSRAATAPAFAIPRQPLTGDTTVPKNRPISPVLPINTQQLRYRPIGIDAARITAGVWAKWQDDNKAITTPHSFDWLERDGTIDNLRRLDPRSSFKGERRGLWFTDSDLYKALEAVAWETARTGTSELDELMEAITSIIVSAQQSDGYINSFVQAGLDVRWDNLVKSHELYCIGHLIQAGIADKRATGRDALFDAAVKAANVVVADFGNMRRPDTDGHEEIEMALVELYRETGDRKYLELAEQLIDVRGHDGLDASEHFDNAYYQDATPVREETTVVGHAVRAIYLLAGVVDLYIETGEPALLDAALTQWTSMNATKTYLNGAVGSRFAGEAFGDSYELPPDLAYGETCATIGNIMLSWRLLLATGESRFADAIERALYNLFSASTSVDRTGFFYNNPAQRRDRYPAAPVDARPNRADAPGTRPAWFECACCPPNIMRTVASLAAYLATNSDNAVQLHQYVSAESTFELLEGPVQLRVQTAYPIEDKIRVIVVRAPGSEWTLELRRPDWARAMKVRVNGVPVESHLNKRGYLEISRVWAADDRVDILIPLEPRFTVAHPSVDAVRGAVAIERGPVVYAFESPDQQEGTDLNHVELDVVYRLIEERVSDFLGGETVVIRAKGFMRDDSGWKNEGWARREELPKKEGAWVDLVAIPYALWANRGPSIMRIFVPVYN